MRECRRKVIALALVALFFVGALFPVKGYATQEEPNNLISGNGFVDVTPLGAEELANGQVKYSYQVSMLPHMSNTGSQIANNFIVTVPDLISDIKFTLIGTQEALNDDGTSQVSKEYNNYAVDLEELKNNPDLLQPRDVNKELGIFKYTADTEFDKNDELYDELYDTKGIPFYNDLSQGFDIPSIVLEYKPWEEGYSAMFGMNPYYPFFQVFGIPLAEMKFYQYSLTSEIPGPVAMRVDLFVEKEVAIANPKLALDARIAHFCFYEGGGSGSHEDGCILMDRRRPCLNNPPSPGYLTEQYVRHLLTTADKKLSFAYVGNPDLLEEKSYDKDGLHGTADVAVTKYSGRWNKIGKDTPEALAFVRNFYLEFQPMTTFLATYYEDMADAAVVQILKATHSFISKDGSDLPQEVKALLPADLRFLNNGDTVNPTLPSTKEVSVPGGQWVFKGYQPPSVIIEDQDVNFEGTWEFVSHSFGNYLGFPAPYANHTAYIKGYPDGTVRPEGKITRAEASAMVSRLQALDLSNKAKPNYMDVESGWYNEYLNAVLEKDMLLAEEGKLRPNDAITRAEFARLIEPIDKDATLIESQFEDVKGHKFEKAITKAYLNERIHGYPDGSFKPDDAITRTEAAKILNNLYDRKVEERGLLAVTNIEKLQHFPDLSEDHWGYYELVEASDSHKYERYEKDSIEERWLEILLHDIK